MEPKQHNREMNLAWQFVEGTDVSVFLTGKAGTGKTTFLRRVRELSPKRMVVVAPTGVAAINARGVTIHSFFQLPIGIHLPGVEHQEQGSHFRMSQEKKNIIRTLELLIIDEISMVRADLLDAVDSVLRKYRDKYRPFGGVQLLLIGDLQQLAPVASDKEWELLKNHYETPYFFSSKALKQIQYVAIELQHIYRQSDEHFIRLLGNIREGRLDAATVQELNQRYIPNFNPPSDEEYIRLTTHNYMAQRYNDSKLAALSSESVVYQAVVDGEFPETSYPADASLTLKAGSQVMFIKNDPSTDHAYFNGKIGRVVRLTSYNVTVFCQDDGKTIEVGMGAWENTKYEINEETKEITEKVVGTFQQIPLRLAWAITVHKSQGLTFDHAVLDINDSFAHGQVYVALSRCRSLEGMVLSRPLDIQSLLIDEKVNSYIYNELESSVKAEEQLAALRFRYFQKLLHEVFDFQRLQSDTHYVTRVLEEHLANQYPRLTEAWKEASKQIDDNVQGVALRFRQQLTGILSRSTDYRHDPLLAERIEKGANYFAEKLSTLPSLTNLTAPLLGKKETKSSDEDFAIGNKAVKKQFGNAFSQFMLTYRTAVGVLQKIIDHGFSVKTYLSDKACAMLDEDEPKKKKTKTKEPKEKTWVLSFRLYQEGKNVREIAIERTLSVSTIYSHLARYVESGEIDGMRLTTPEHVSEVEQLIERAGWPENAYAFSKMLPDIGYGELNIILLILKQKNNSMW